MVATALLRAEQRYARRGEGDANMLTASRHDLKPRTSSAPDICNPKGNPMNFASAIPLLAAALAAPAFANDAALQLAQKNNCAACHAVDKKLVGPSWSDIGKKYAGDATAEARLVTKAKTGGVGAWGQVPMPPNAAVKEADIKAIVKYTLSLK